MKNGESNEYNDLGSINKSFYVDDKKEGWETYIITNMKMISTRV